MAPNPCDKDKPLKKGGLEQTVSVPLLLQVILEYGHRPVCCLFYDPGFRIRIQKTRESGSGTLPGTDSVSKISSKLDFFINVNTYLFKLVCRRFWT